MSCCKKSKHEFDKMKRKGHLFYEEIPENIDYEKAFPKPKKEDTYWEPTDPCENCPNNKPNQINICHCTLPHYFRNSW